MRSLRIRGGSPLEGTLTISGGKNAALPVLASTVLFQEECRIENCPDLSDVDAALAILTHLGAVCHREGKAVTVDPRPICHWEIPQELMSRMRGSVFFMGPLMARFGRCRLAQPGGCPIGSRPVDFHLGGLKGLGAVTGQSEALECSGELKGAVLRLPFPSVGATENLLMAALGAEGETVIENAAREPEILCLCNFLRAGGCRIWGDGSSVIRVHGGLPAGAAMELIPDRMEAATYLCAVASAGGRLRLEHTRAEHLQSVIAVLKRAGCVIGSDDTSITIQAEGLISPGTIVTGPYPAFPTDAQAPMMAALLKATGQTEFQERVFSDRMRHIPGLQAMGGRIAAEGGHAVVTGTDRLFGAKAEASDLRGGAALVVAALAAEGESEITGLRHLLRGYEDIAGKLHAIGAEVVFG